MAEEEWDTGAEAAEAQQDKFNKFDPNSVQEHPQEQQEIVRSEPKPQVKPVQLEVAPEVIRSPPQQQPKKQTTPPTKPQARPSNAGQYNNNRNSPKTNQFKQAGGGAGSPRMQPKLKAAPAAPSPPKAMGNKKVAATMEVSAPRTFSTRLDEAPKGAAFTEKLSPEALAYFSDVCAKPFSQQGVAFLNAYWPEIGSQAEFIFSCAWEKMKYADMHSKGIQYIHLYDEGNDLDFNIGLYFYEKLCNEVLESSAGKKWRDDPHYAASMPVMMTALVRKQELREKVDVNFDGRISFLEYLLYQYREYANPGDFVTRSMASGTEHPEITAARQALEDVNAAIRAYETEKTRLTNDSKLPGVKGLQAKALLAILNASPLAEKLNVALITAEAAVRKAVRLYGGESASSGDAAAGGSKSSGALWWMNRDLADKKARYGR